MRRWDEMVIEGDRPSCHGLTEAFVDFDSKPPSGEDLEQLVEICIECPFMQICGEYAKIIKPEMGVWAGKRWSRGAIIPSQREHETETA